MAEQFKEMSPEDVREQKMRDRMGKAADKARESSLGKADKQDAKDILTNGYKPVKDALRKGIDYVGKGIRSTVDAFTPESEGERQARQVSEAQAEAQRTMPRDLTFEKRAKDAGYKKGGCVKMAKGGSASSRADGIAVRGKTRGTIC
jgi:hypothetical protein